MKRPCSLVTYLVVALVCVLTTRTETAGAIAPLASVTAPTSLPESCAWTATLKRKHNHSHANDDTLNALIVTPMVGKYSVAARAQASTLMILSIKICAVRQML